MHRNIGSFMYLYFILGMLHYIAIIFANTVLLWSFISSDFLPLRVAGMFALLYTFFKGSRGLLEPISVFCMGEARAHPGWDASSSQGPYWWQRPPHKVPTAQQEQFWGSVCCSRILRHCNSVPSQGAGIQTSSDLAITSWPAVPTELQPPHHLCGQKSAQAHVFLCSLCLTDMAARLCCPACWSQ